MVAQGPDSPLAPFPPDAAAALYHVYSLSQALQISDRF